MTPREEDYDVGYGRPPRHTQWKPGQSGNPKGRPKRIKDFEKLFELELDQRIQITDRGEPCTLSKRELVVKKLINDALQGDRSAMKLVVSLMQRSPSVEGFEPDPADREALFALFERAGREDAAGKEVSDDDS